MNQVNQPVLSENDLCIICEEMETDSVKMGFWAYDLTCAVCIEKQAKYEKREVPMILDSPSGMVEHEMLALGAISRKLNSLTIKKNQK